jgi:sec-independent protein translocase protein TatA
MISTPGPLELLLILGLALLVLGPSRLPDAARSAGKAVRDFREALSGGEEDHDEFAVGDEELVESGPAGEAEYRDRVAELPDPEPEPAKSRTGNGTEAGDPAPPPVS